MSLSIIDIELIDLEPIDREPIDVEPIDTGPIHSECTSLVSLMLTEPLNFVDCLAYIIMSLHPEFCLFKTNFPHILPPVTATNAYMHFSTHTMTHKLAH